MGQRISGTGVGLAPPQFLYPSEINPAQVAPDFGNNRLSLSPGDVCIVPAGAWYARAGRYCMWQFFDPVGGNWRGLQAANPDLAYVVSDGFNLRIANMTGCPVAAVVTAGGSGFTSTPTVTAGTGTSTWQAIVGGMLSLTTINNAGKNYGLPPLVMLPDPPTPGVAATAVTTITSGTVSALSFINQGAGYVTTPTAVIVPNPADPNLATTTPITPATVTLAIVGAGSISAVLCTNSGASVSSAPTLTVAGGGGSGATVSSVWCSSLVSATVASSGTWTGGAALESIGGFSGSTPWNTNPEVSGNYFVSRPIQALLSGGSSSLTSISTTYDGGLFLSTPTLIVAAVGGNVPSSLATATITATYGGVSDTCYLQPAP